MIPDNMPAIVDRAHPTEPRINRTFAEYAQDRGFLIEPGPGHGQPGHFHEVPFHRRISVLG